MKRKQQVSKNTRQTENVASNSPYINRCGEYTIEAEFAGSSSSSVRPTRKLQMIWESRGDRLQGRSTRLLSGFVANLTLKHIMDGSQEGFE